MAYINDTRYPSVTEILKPYVDSKWFTDESRIRGDMVHAVAAAHLTGLFCPPVSEEHRGYCESVKKWIDDVVVDVLLVERRLEDSKLGFCGKPDAVVRVKGDKDLSLLDFKTGQSLLKAWRLQIAAYRYLLKTAIGIETLRGFSVRPKPDGSGCMPVVDYARDYRRDFNIFLGLLNANKYFQK